MNRSLTEKNHVTGTKDNLWEQLGLFDLVQSFGAIAHMSAAKKIERMDHARILQSTITCPHCGFQKEETMPIDACQYFYQCENCKTMLKPKQGQCCVFCSYGNIPCPSIQEDGNCCGKG